MAYSTNTLRAVVERRANGLCEYCHAPQRVCGYRFHLEHIVPASQGGDDWPSNRALSCASCNLAKGNRMSGLDPLTRSEVALFNPRTQIWSEHFKWAGDCQSIEGITPCGRATVVALDMNNSDLRRQARLLWFESGYLP